MADIHESHQFLGVLCFLSPWMSRAFRALVLCFMAVPCFGPVLCLAVPCFGPVLCLAVPCFALVQQVIWGKLLGKPSISLVRTLGQCIRNRRFIDCDKALGLKSLEQRSEFFLCQLILENRADCAGQCLERSWL